MGGYGYKVGAVEGSGLHGNRGSVMDSGEAKEWLCSKDQHLSPPHRPKCQVSFVFKVTLHLDKFGK